MPYDPEYFSLVNNVFKESMTGHFFRGFTILGATEKKMHFTLVSIIESFPLSFVESDNNLCFLIKQKRPHKIETEIFL